MRIKTERDARLAATFNAARRDALSDKEVEAYVTDRIARGDRRYMAKPEFTLEAFISSGRSANDYNKAVEDHYTDQETEVLGGKLSLEAFTRIAHGEADEALAAFVSSESLKYLQFQCPTCRALPGAACRSLNRPLASCVGEGSPHGTRKRLASVPSPLGAPLADSINTTAWGDMKVEVASLHEVIRCLQNDVLVLSTQNARIKCLMIDRVLADSEIDDE